MHLRRIEPIRSLPRGSLQWRGLWSALILTVLLAVPGIVLAGAKTRSNWTKPGRHHDPGEDFFKKGEIPSLKITIKGTNLAALQQNNRAYARATVREGNTVYPDVGIHLKGAAGSFRDLNDNPAITLNFDKYEDRQKFHGLDKIHLNNSVQDPSYMTELICGELFRAAGVPAARTTHARVELNGRDLGFYVLKEGFNKSFLRQYFTNLNGNLFDGGFLREISEPLQKMSGTETNEYGALRAAVAAAEEPDPVRRLERLEKAVDLDRFISFIAMEDMTWHWDGYAMKKNNYRVYHDPTSNKIVFFAHGMDQMFWEPNGSLVPPNLDGLLARSLLETPKGRQRYLRRMKTLLTEVFRVEALTNRLNEVQARIRPVLETMSADKAREHDGAVDHLRNEIVQRAFFLERQLNLPEAKPVVFDASGKANLSDWRPQQERTGPALLEKAASADRPQTLHIRVEPTGKCTSSWRTLLRLEPGQYRFEGEVRTTGVVPITDVRGAGAGLRISRATKQRTNSSIGDSAWKKLEYNFTIQAEPAEVDLVCELRATQGEAWFDLQSLRLVKRAETTDPGQTH